MGLFKPLQYEREEPDHRRRAGEQQAPENPTSDAPAETPDTGAVANGDESADDTS